MALWTGFPAGVGLPKEPVPGHEIVRKALRCQASSQDFERKLSCRFTIPDNILDTASGGAQGDSILFRMPHEILLTVYDSLAHAPSQISLALTCKRMAAAARNVQLCLSLTSPRYAGFLPRSVFDVPDLMAQLKPWMPADLRLCNHCLTNRPRAEEYWNGIVGCEISTFWVQKTGWEFHDASWHKQVHDICPACHVNCSLSDYVDCDGCRALGRLGDIDWSRVSDSMRRRTEEELRAGRFAT
ncbi:hypothetical protein LTS07_006888 [Exophiala sideris]|uniref:F-box domain-containing protein n=1 Tax=Exophiala sideris TaxID=1016849 RepID=A0ABR0J489_9EURO|nr:hypothetical protein LTS07_006888 [Exophiala sideris]KAK5035010.1 hypothetical protein LTR13_006194 [Exophiala sideris]KAK5056256.1 hypothetical protein LTR69_007795 [Exophiala sideris]KAK5181254.1 hypothetical protein LTR44_006587 [Eurotiomycetes sp. CCFEE 6388]